MEQKRTGLSYVFTLAKEERGKLSLGMLLAVFSSALSFVPYLVVYQILLLIIKQEVTLPAMLGWAGIGIAAAVLQAILTSFAGICSHTAAFNTMHRIKVRVLEHMSKFNLGFFQEHAPGQIKTTLFDDVDRIETFLAHSTLELAQAIVVPLMMFIFMLRLNWIMALIMLVPMILGIAIPMALMGRYQTHLAEGGNTLSGGEKQRIAIARAILKDAPILLLDESTASLDADNEAKINQALDRLMKGKTVFVIAHRLNTIQNADQIIVLNQGRIEETGTHEELLRKKGHYYEMVQEQQKAREWIVKGA